MQGPLSLFRHVDSGHGGDQGLRVGVLGCVDDRPGGPTLHEVAEVHDGDAIGDMGSGGQVVSDHEDAYALLAAQTIQQLEDAGTHGDIQHRHGFIGDQQ